MDKETQDKLDKATRALLDMGPSPDKEPKFTKAGLKRKFRFTGEPQG